MSDSGAVAFNQNAGSITGTSTFSLANDTVSYAGGAVTAPTRFSNTALTTAGSATGGATLTMAGTVSTLTGTVSASTTVESLGNGSQGSSQLTATAGTVNNGVIRLTSIEGGWGSELSSPGLTNAGPGVIVSEVGTSGPRTLSGTITNNGTITFNQPSTLNALTLTNAGNINVNAAVGNGSGVTINQNSGTITGTAVLRLDGDTFNYTNGVVNAPNTLYNSALTTAGGATGGATFNLGGNSSLTGTVSSSTTVVSLGDATVGSSTLTASSGVVNNGVIRLSSTGGGWNATLTSPGLTNAATIITDVGTGGARTLSGAISNSGSITFDQPGTLSALTLTNTGSLVLNAAVGNGSGVTINQNGGSITGAGTLRLDGDTFNYNSGTVSAPNLLYNGALNTAGSASGVATLTSGGTTATLAGVIAPSTTVVVLGDATAGGATLTSAAGITNNGAITLTSVGGGWGSTAVFGGTGLDNNGTLNFNAGTGGPRTFTGHLVNDGTVTVNASTTFSTTSGVYTNNSAFNLTAGTLSMTGLSQAFTQAAGTLDVTTGGMVLNGMAFTFNGGTIPGTGLVARNAAITLGPTATGLATITADASSGTLSGNVGANTTLVVLGNATAGSATLGAAAPVVNNGTIRLDSTGGGWGAAFTANGGLTNNGTLVSSVGSAGPRTFNGVLTNIASGTFTVDQSMSMPTGGAAHSNAGNATIANTMTLTVGGAGTTLLNNGIIGGDGTLILSSDVVLSGIGAATNTLLLGTAKVAPGTSPGIMNMSKNFVMGNGTALNIELAGPGAGVGYDQLNVVVNATFSLATLNVSLLGGYVPCNGATFDVATYGTRTGTFSTVNAPAGMTVTYLPNILRLTSTTGAACTPGGKGLDIRGTASAVELTWDGGNNQASYTLLRYNTVTATAELISPIAANVVSHNHTTATAGTLYCYLLAANGPGATVLGLSDLLCGWRGAASGAVQAQNFTLSLNQSTNATLTWTAPVGGADSYLLQRIPLDGSAATPVALGGGVTSNVQAVPAAGSCYQLVAFKAAAFGVTNTICGLPGFSTLSGVSMGQIVSAVEATLSPLSTNGGLQAFKPEGWLE